MEKEKFETNITLRLDLDLIDGKDISILKEIQSPCIDWVTYNNCKTEGFRIHTGFTETPDSKLCKMLNAGRAEWLRIWLPLARLNNSSFIEFSPLEEGNNFTTTAEMDIGELCEADSDLLKSRANDGNFDTVVNKPYGITYRINVRDNSYKYLAPNVMILTHGIKQKNNTLPPEVDYLELCEINWGA